MRYQPRRLDSEIPETSKRFAARAGDGKLSLYIGAGVSKADPTGLPLGGELSNLAMPAAQVRFAEYFGKDEEQPSSLEELGSLLGNARRSELNALLLRLAEFTRAHPNYGHRALALLLLLGLATVMSANWDTCIERAAADMGGRLDPTVTEADRINSPWSQRLHKIHGCAEDSESLLVSTEELAQPPDWVSSAVNAELGADTIVFLGLGTVGDYVATRIKQLLDYGAESLDEATVVAYNGDLSDGWANLLPEERRNVIAATADDFLDDLLRALAADALLRAYEPLGELDDEPLKQSLDLLIERLRTLDAMAVLRWWTDGAEPALRGGALFDPTASMQLLAVARLAAGEATVSWGNGVATVEIPEAYIELARVQGGTGEAMRRRQEGRLERRIFLHRDKPVLVLYSGDTLTLVPPRARDVAEGEPDRLSVVEGASGPAVDFRRLDDVLHAEAA